jgi:hypothetical protein
LLIQGQAEQIVRLGVVGIAGNSALQMRQSLLVVALVKGVNACLEMPFGFVGSEGVDPHYQ